MAALISWPYERIAKTRGTWLLHVRWAPPRSILKRTANAAPPPRRLWGREMAALASAEGLPPSDEQTVWWLDERRLARYV